MKHYEFVIMVHPDQSEQVPTMIQRYETLIKNAGGTVHRLEDWGRRQLAYPIQKIHKAHYLLMNVECGYNTIQELVNNFRFNDAIIRHLVVARKMAVTTPSPILRTKDVKKREEQVTSAEAAQTSEPEVAVSNPSLDEEEITPKN